MDDEIEKYMYKIIMVGESNTGKTTLSTKYCYEQYLEQVQIQLGCYLTKILKKKTV